MDSRLADSRLQLALGEVIGLGVHVLFLATVSVVIPLQLFVELNELIVEKDHEMRWKERARWIKFEEDVEEETDRWGKPHVASLSFRSLLELRRTITHGKRLPNHFFNMYSI